MEPIKINHKELENEINAGTRYIQLGKKKYLLMEVNEVYGYDSYEVTDPEEEEKLKSALEDDNPILVDVVINKTLGINK